MKIEKKKLPKFFSQGESVLISIIYLQMQTTDKTDIYRYVIKQV